MKRKRITYIAVAVLLLASASYGFWRFSNRPKEPPYITAALQAGDITQVVTATGTLSAVTTVQVGSQVS